MDGDVVFFGGARESERMPLEVGDLGAGKEDVLTSASRGLFLLDLEFHDIRRVLDDLGDVGNMAGADFAENTLANPNDTTNEPVTLEVPESEYMVREICRNQLTQKTPIVLKEQYGGLSGLIMQNIP